jgi:hypothetical protein
MVCGVGKEALAALRCRAVPTDCARNSCDARCALAMHGMMAMHISTA